MSGLLAHYQMGANQASIHGALADEALGVESKLRQRIGVYEYGLRGARGVVAVTQPTSSRALFRRYAEGRDIDREFPGARGFGYIRRVPVEKIEDFLFPRVWTQALQVQCGAGLHVQCFQLLLVKITDAQMLPYGP